MKKLFLFLILTFTTLNVYAKWVFFDNAIRELAYGKETYDSYYYEDTSIKILNDNKRRVWVFGNFSQKNSRNFKSIQSYEEYNCEDETYKVLQANGYPEKNLEGKSSRISETEFSGISYIEPDGLRKTLYKILCNKK